MEKVLDKMFSTIEKIGKHNILLVLFIFGAVLTTKLYTTFSLGSSVEKSEIIDGLTTYKFILNNNELINTVSIAANSSKNIDITVSNNDTLKLKYGIYYSSIDDLSDVVVNYVPNSKYPSTGLIDANSNYVVTIKIINNSKEKITLDFGLLFGLEKGGELELDFNKFWVSEANFINKVESGSYVKYIGNNGCSSSSCEGMNANRSDQSNGYCYNSIYQYSYSGWRVAYVDGEYAYLISAGAPECLCTNSDGSLSNSSCNSNEKTEGTPLHIANLNNIALKYCNTKYVAGGVCNNSTTWAMNEMDFNKITNTEIKYCNDLYETPICGYGNELIDNDGEYWIATPTTSEINPPFHVQNWLAIEKAISDNRTSESFGVRPVVKLDKNVFIVGGTGTEIDPYIIER